MARVDTSRGMRYIISRNSSKRPTLMHELRTFEVTLCGVSTVGWSKAYFAKPSGALLCVKCKRLH